MPFFQRGLQTKVEYVLNIVANIRREWSELTFSEISDLVHMRVLSWGRKL